MKRKSKVKQELVWGSEGREEEQAAQKGEDRERERERERETDRQTDRQTQDGAWSHFLFLEW